MRFTLQAYVELGIFNRTKCKSVDTIVLVLYVLQRDKKGHREINYAAN